MSTPSVKVAVVTGASQGIGRAIALRLAQDGLNVVVNDLSSKEKQLEELIQEIDPTKRKALSITGDMSCEADVQRLIDVAVAQFGGVDVMVANAGIALTGPITSATVEEWDRVHSINCRGTFLAYKVAANQMIKQGRGGRIIGFPEWGVYCASKFAVKGLTQAVAAELKQYDITVNTYAPGLVDTPIWKGISENRTTKQLGNLPVSDKWKVLPSEDVAGLVSYLAKDEARFITGESIGINGGLLLG